MDPPLWAPASPLKRHRPLSSAAIATHLLLGPVVLPVRAGTNVASLLQ